MVISIDKTCIMWTHCAQLHSNVIKWKKNKKMCIRFPLWKENKNVCRAIEQFCFPPNKCNFLLCSTTTACNVAFVSCLEHFSFNFSLTTQLFDILPHIIEGSTHFTLSFYHFRIFISLYNSYSLSHSIG